MYTHCILPYVPISFRTFQNSDTNSYLLTPLLLYISKGSFSEIYFRHVWTTISLPYSYSMLSIRPRTVGRTVGRGGPMRRKTISGNGGLGKVVEEKEERGGGKKRGSWKKKWLWCGGTCSRTGGGATLAKRENKSPVSLLLLLLAAGAT